MMVDAFMAHVCGLVGSCAIAGRPHSTSEAAAIDKANPYPAMLLLVLLGAISTHDLRPPHRPTLSGCRGSWELLSREVHQTINGALSKPARGLPDLAFDLTDYSHVDTIVGVGPDHEPDGMGQRMCVLGLSLVS